MAEASENKPKVVLARRIAELQRERSVNDEQVSKGTGWQAGQRGPGKIGVSPRTVGYMKQPDVGNPTIDNLIAVAEYFGVAVWELLFDPERDAQKLIARSLRGRTFEDATRDDTKRGQRDQR